MDRWIEGRRAEDRRTRQAAGVQLKEGKFFRGTTGSGSGSGSGGGVCRAEPRAAVGGGLASREPGIGETAGLGESGYPKSPADQTSLPRSTLTPLHLHPYALTVPIRRATWKTKDRNACLRPRIPTASAYSLCLCISRVPGAPLFLEMLHLPVSLHVPTSPTSPTSVLANRHRASPPKITNQNLVGHVFAVAHVVTWSPICSGLRCLSHASPSQGSG